MSSIKNIIFDLGGVILNIDFQRTHEAFQKLGGIKFATLYSQQSQSSVFDEFEIGRISADTFRNTLKTQLNLNIRDEEFDAAWNAMLLNLPKKRLDFIYQLRKEFRIFLFSNTNEIHLKKITQICQLSHGISSLHDYFEKEYYSCRFGRRKPHPDAFQTILYENDIKANETLFIDDTLQHVLGAKQAGLKTVHLTQDKTILDVIYERI